MNMNIQLCHKEKQFLATMRVMLASLLTTIALLLATVSSPAHAASRIVWSDNFTGVNLDASKWNVVNAPSWNKGEWESYSSNNVSLNHDSLLLKSDNANNGYTSGEVNTFQRYTFTYGRVDIQAKLPHGQGIWPSFWLLTANCQMYPSTGSGCTVTPTQSYGEVDIMEMLGQNPHYIYLTNHFGYYPRQNLSHQCTYTGPDYSADYHVFSIDWRPGSLTWLIDGVPHCHQTDGVPNGPMFLVLNTAIGGLFPGNPNVTTQFPQYTQIGYVHISQ
ncbi:MAG: glycoside hydrolase family 16 protein [Ktedonobacteraceae bacterium]|nr:glycoside hydrolase family 16 protein [Ktedonobacteraceae bacterium]